jgi:hypothetical protein
VVTNKLLPFKTKVYNDRRDARTAKNIREMWEINKFLPYRIKERRFKQGVRGNKISGILPAPRTRVPHISPVVGEMWDCANLNLKPIGLAQILRDRAAKSHISRKTSEIWGTRRRSSEFSNLLEGLAHRRSLHYAALRSG